MKLSFIVNFISHILCILLISHFCDVCLILIAEPLLSSCTFTFNSHYICFAEYSRIYMHAEWTRVFELTAETLNYRYRVKRRKRHAPAIEGRSYPSDRSIFPFAETERSLGQPVSSWWGTYERVLPTEMKLLAGESESRRSGRRVTTSRRPGLLETRG